MSDWAILAIIAAGLLLGFLAAIIWVPPKTMREEQEELERALKDLGEKIEMEVRPALLKLSEALEAGRAFRKIRAADPESTVLGEQPSNQSPPSTSE